MKNITLSVDEEVLRVVRRYAAEHDSTVNAIVREYLTGIARREDRVRDARRRLLELSSESEMRFGKKSWTRDDLHER